MPAKKRKQRPTSTSPRPRARVASPKSGQVVDPSGNPVPEPAPTTTGRDGTLPGYSRLTPRQQAALPVVALSPSLAQAARWSGVSESTLRRWQADPAFEELVVRVRQDTSRQAGQEIQSLLPRCVSIFSEAMDSPDLAMRLRAARYVLSLVGRFGESQQLSTDILNLETVFKVAPKP